MNDKVLKTLEFDKIREKLASYASSDPGRSMCLKTVPLTDRSAIELLLDETGAAMGRLIRNGGISFGSAKDVGASLKRLEIGSPLGIHELLMIAGLLENAGTVKAYGRRKKEEDEEADALTEFFNSLEPLSNESGEIRRCIISEDEISDDASPGLRRVRRNIRLANDRVRSELTRLVSSSSMKDVLQDSIVTTRDGRYCIPVKSEHRTQVQGIIHDTSKTGSTVFIEPASVVRLNNEIRELHLEEVKEIEAVLQALSESLMDKTGFIAADYSTLIALDYIFARAHLALEMNGTRPVIGEDAVIDLKKARHPLIPKKTVVPIDVRLGEGFDLLVVTGPNTGGKTVSLKTVGLLTLMGLSGLFVPAAEHSRISIFKEVYADIGDEQSIEQSLSTFSSHMTNVVSILESADDGSLVLFDELGAGTDPTEGAALAISILDRLHGRGIRTMATTHYSEIKIYALRTEGVENASCEFNVETLSPTYRLLIGVPGKSNAFAISRKLGLPEEIIDEARSRLSREDTSFEDVISDLEKQRAELEEERIRAENERREIQRLRHDMQKKEESISKRKQGMISDSSAEARRILQEAKDYADKTISWYAKRGGDTREMEIERTRLRERINALGEGVGSAFNENAEKGDLTPDDIRIGDSIKVISLGLKGTINSMPDSKGNLFVNIGAMRTKVKLDDLVLVPPEEDKTASRKTSSGKIGMAKSLAVSQEINLLGKTVDEAVAALDKYLDDAAIAHLDQVRIVHGKGTGALREGVQKYLRKNKHVASFRLGEFGEGDAGVTIAKLK